MLFEHFQLKHELKPWLKSDSSVFVTKAGKATSATCLIAARSTIVMAMALVLARSLVVARRGGATNCAEMVAPTCKENAEGEQCFGHGQCVDT